MEEYSRLIDPLIEDSSGRIDTVDRESLRRMVDSAVKGSIVVALFKMYSPKALQDVKREVVSEAAARMSIAAGKALVDLTNRKSTLLKAIMELDKEFAMLADKIDAYDAHRAVVVSNLGWLQRLRHDLLGKSVVGRAVRVDAFGTIKLRLLALFSPLRLDQPIDWETNMKQVSDPFVEILNEKYQNGDPILSTASSKLALVDACWVTLTAFIAENEAPYKEIQSEQRKINSDKIKYKSELTNIGNETFKAQATMRECSRYKDPSKD